MINIENLTKYYQDFCALDSISLNVDKGEILGLLGPNAAGKTTTLRILTGYFKPTSGEVKIKDFDLSEQTREVKKIIGYLPESAPIYRNMITFDYLNYLADIRRLRDNNKHKRIKELVEICGLHNVMHKTVNELSKGYKQRVGLAHALLHDPEILILDEPTSGLDPNQILEIRELIKRIGQEKTVILSTHILSEAEATCDRMVIINQGKIVADETPENLKAGPSSGTVHLTLCNGSKEDMQKALSQVPGVQRVDFVASQEEGHSFCLNCSTSTDPRPKIYNFLKSTDWVVLEFYQEVQNLENIFRKLTTEN